MELIYDHLEASRNHTAQGSCFSSSVTVVNEIILYSIRR